MDLNNPIFNNFNNNQQIQNNFPQNNFQGQSPFNQMGMGQIDMNQNPMNMNQNPMNMNQNPMNMNQNPMDMNQNPMDMNQNPMNMNQIGMNPMNMNQIGMNPMNMNQMGMNPMNMNQIGMNPMNINQMGMNPMLMNQMGMNQFIMNQIAMNQMGMNQMDCINQIDGINQAGMNQMDMNQGQNFSNNIASSQINNTNNSETITVKFIKFQEGYNITAVLCTFSEKVKDLINDYRKKTGDYDLTERFIFNTKNLCLELTVAEQGLINGSKIKIIVIKGIKGAI